MGDTLGPGDIFRALRTLPVLMALGNEMDDLAPDALLLNYVNHKSVNCWGFYEATGRPHYVNVQSLIDEAALAGDRDVVRDAISLDPLIAAVCTLDQIRDMTNEKFAAQKHWLPQFS